MSQNKSLLVFFICFRLYTASSVREQLKIDHSLNVLPKYKEIFDNGKPLPLYFDWRRNDGVTPVKDQDTCGACWAFSALANIESQLKIHQHRDVILSEQFLIDCNHIQAGCSGASVLKTFSDIITNIGGVLPTADYPEYEQRPRQCRWDNNHNKLFPVIGFKRIKADEEEMVKALYHYGPLSAAINSGAMKNYFRNKTIDQPSEQTCPHNPEHQDHAVLIVGYSTYISPDGKQEVPYWIIKNSWGTDWGDEGFYYLERGTNACGIANDVSFAFIPRD